MIVNVANPIYDSVFKYLMEDERIAKTILSALLKKEVLSVAVRPHEYSNTTRDPLSLFRIDFSATVREADGTERVMAVELQKTWLNTETLRFRQYLGLQYNSKANIREESEKGYAYPLVAVYLLGHRVGDINEPVVYVNHKVYDYDGREVPGGTGNPFVESLTHDSIIVQIPLLRGQVNNRLEKVLSIFDQTRMNARDTHTLVLDENQYSDDSEMMYMLHRLTAAAASADIRQDMNVEDEYYQAIEDRDTAIMQRDRQLKEKQLQLKEKQLQLNEKQMQLKEKQMQLNEKQLQLDEQTKQLDEQTKQLDEQNIQLSKMAKTMAKNGMDAASIAKATGMDTDKIMDLLK